MKLHIQRPKTKQITFRIAQEVYEAVKKISLKEGVSIPEICRALIDLALKSEV